MSPPARRIRLMIITTEYHHGLRYRLHHFLPYLVRWFDVKVLSIAPALYDVDVNDSSLLPQLAIWIRQVLPHLRTKLIQHHDGNTIVRSFPWSHVFFHRIDMAILAAIFLMLSRLNLGFDVFFASPHMAGLVALLAGLRPLVYDDVDRLTHFSSNPVKRTIFKTIEGFCIRNASTVVSAGYSLGRSAERIRGGRVEIVPNAVDASLFKKSEAPLSGRLTMIYVGSIEHWSGLEEAIRALALLQREYSVDATLLVVGRGSQQYVSSLRRISSEEGVEERVELREPVPYSQLPTVLSNCHLGLATFDDSEVSWHAFPFKVLEYMAAGLPLVVSGIKDAAEIVDRFRCGFNVPHERRAIADAVYRIVKDEVTYRRMSINAVEGARKLELGVQAEKLRVIIEGLASTVK